DRDNDVIRDDLDKCPDDPETYNMFEDEDGCPDDARDAGQLVDTSAGWPKAGPKGDNHWPRRAPVVVGQTSSATPDSSRVEFDKAIIRKKSYPILDNVAAALHDNPDIQLVEVLGHTDERGDDDYNLDLSNRRAAAVVKYLTEHGIATDRLTSTGYGETRPIDPRHNEAE